MLYKILTIVLAFQATWYAEGEAPETDQERIDRVTMVGRAIFKMASDSDRVPFSKLDKAALLLTIIKHESSLDYHVHAGLKSKLGSQDKGKARCLGQIHRSEYWWPDKQDWLDIAGTSRAATERCLDSILRVLGYHVKRCGLRRYVSPSKRWDKPLRWDEVGVLLNAYGDGKSCSVRNSRGQLSRRSWWLKYREQLRE